MAFFNTQPNDADRPSVEHLPPEQSDRQAGHQSGAPLFRQDDATATEQGGQHVSLSDYISRHFAEGQNAANKSAETKPQAQKAAHKKGLPLQTPFQSAGQPHIATEGRVLNQMDVDLQAGLEQYLPTPVFRLRVMKKRLNGEIAELKMRLNKYERLNDPSREMQERMQALQDRIATLETHEQVVGDELAIILGFGPVVYQLIKMVKIVSGRLDQVGFGFRNLIRRIFFGKGYLEVTALAEKLTMLEEMMAERLNDKTTSDAEISRILNRYEQILQKTEAATQQAPPQFFGFSGGFSGQKWLSKK